jgi:hypothetical protein
VADSTPGELTADELAAFRGCDLSNDCYGDCLRAAQNAIDAGVDPEIDEAKAWAARHA